MNKYRNELKYTYDALCFIPDSEIVLF